MLSLGGRGVGLEERRLRRQVLVVPFGWVDDLGDIRGAHIDGDVVGYQVTVGVVYAHFVRCVIRVGLEVLLSRHALAHHFERAIDRLTAKLAQLLL